MSMYLNDSIENVCTGVGLQLRSLLKKTVSKYHNLMCLFLYMLVSNVIAVMRRIMILNVMTLNASRYLDFFQHICVYHQTWSDM